jgi:hypothetical protein
MATASKRASLDALSEMKELRKRNQALGKVAQWWPLQHWRDRKAGLLLARQLNAQRESAARQQAQQRAEAEAESAMDQHFSYYP